MLFACVRILTNSSCITTFSPKISPAAPTKTPKLYYYMEKSIIFAKIFRLRVCSICHQSAAFAVEYNIG